MAKISKRLAALKATVDRNKLYPVDDALTLVKSAATAKFNESVDVAVNLGIDPRKSDQVVRGSVVLPRGTGKDQYRRLNIHRIDLGVLGNRLAASSKMKTDYEFFELLHRAGKRPPERPLLLYAWLLLFVVNAGQVMRTQGEVWSISENPGQATVRMFFSPSCSACREGIDILSGSVDVAFCPVAENDTDVARVERMLLLLEEGKSLREAVAACQNVEEPGPWAFLHPGQWGLRLRLQRNRAHIFNAGSRTVPFFEYHGLPAMLKKQAQPPAPARAQEPVIEFSPAGGQTFPDAVLPLEPQVAGQCGGPAPCP